MTTEYKSNPLPDRYKALTPEQQRLFGYRICHYIWALGVTAKTRKQQSDAAQLEQACIWQLDSVEDPEQQTPCACSEATGTKYCAIHGPPIPETDLF